MLVGNFSGVVSGCFVVPPRCSHFFCTSCATELLRTHSRCSVCRAEVRLDQTTCLGKVLHEYDMCKDRFNGKEKEGAGAEDEEGEEAGAQGEVSFYRL